MSNNSNYIENNNKVYNLIYTISLLLSTALTGFNNAIENKIKNGSITKNDIPNIISNLNKLPKVPNPNMSSQIGGEGEGEEKPNVTELELQPGVKELVRFLMKMKKSSNSASNFSLHIIGKIAYKTISNVFEKLIDTTVPEEYRTKSYSELNPELTNKLININNNIELILKDEYTRKVFSDYFKNLTSVGIESLEIIKPQIDQLVNQITQVVNDVGSKTVENSMTVATSLIMTAVSNVPVLGPLVIGAIQSNRIANQASDTILNAVTGTSKAINSMTNVFKDLADIFEKNSENLINGTRDAKMAYDNVQNILNTQNPMSQPQLPPPPPYQQGGAKDIIKINKKLTKIKNRIHKSIKNFIKSNKHKNKKSSNKTRKHNKNQ